MIEMPVAQDTATAQRLVDAFAKAGLIGATEHVERYNPSLQQARKRLEAGELGRVYQVALVDRAPSPPGSPMSVSSRT